MFGQRYDKKSPKDALITCRFVCDKRLEGVLQRLGRNEWREVRGWRRAMQTRCTKHDPHSHRVSGFSPCVHCWRSERDPLQRNKADTARRERIKSDRQHDAVCLDDGGRDEREKCWSTIDGISRSGDELLCLGAGSRALGVVVVL